MTDDTSNLVLEHLRAIRANMGEMKQHLSNVEVQLSSMGQQLGALTTAVYSGKSDMDDLRRRVERIDQRLDLMNQATLIQIAKEKTGNTDAGLARTLGVERQRIHKWQGSRIRVLPCIFRAQMSLLA